MHTEAGSTTDWWSLRLLLELLAVGVGYPEIRVLSFEVSPEELHISFVSDTAERPLTLPIVRSELQKDERLRDASPAELAFHVVAVGLAEPKRPGDYIVQGDGAAIIISSSWLDV
jgi:hypothetical protein